MKNQISKFTLMFISLVLNISLIAQNGTLLSHAWQESGLPYIQNFSPQDYNGGIQNFSIVQDKRGLMYFGNKTGVLNYDGVSWRLINMPNKSAVRSLCVVHERIYVGAVGELGYLAPDATGGLHFTSLRNEIPEAHREFEDVYSTLAIGDTIYFSTQKAIFRLVDGKMRIWPSTSPMQHIYTANRKLFVVRRGLGLMHICGDSLQLLPAGETLSGKVVRTIIPFDSSRILIGTFAHGLFLYDGVGIEPFSTTIDSFLYKNQLRQAANLPGGLIALATVSGVAIIDRDGQFRQIVNKAAGLRNEYILSLLADHQGGLWLGLNNGIARIETPAPISRFKARLGIESYVESIIRHQGRLYISTDRGVRYLDTTTEPFPVFKTVTGFSTLSWFFLSTNAGLLVGTQDGIFRITGKSAKRLNHLPAVILYRSKIDSTKFFAGTLNGLVLLQRSGNNWVHLGMVSDVKERVYAIVEDDVGSLWAGTPSQRVLKIEPNFTQIAQGHVQMPVTRFGEKHGVPPGLVRPAVIGKKVFFMTSQGLKRYDAQSGLFVPDSTFGAAFADTLTRFAQLREDTRSDVWIVASRGDENYTGQAVHQADGSYRWNSVPFSRMQDLGEVNFVYPENDGTVWFCGGEGLARYEPAIGKDYARDYPVLIRRVSSITADSIFYDGGFPEKPRHFDITYQNNSLRFNFAAMSYDNARTNHYQVKLDGFDRGWSNWTGDTKKDYTGLPPGDYTFCVRAQNIYGQLSSVRGFSFTILSPWYRRWWADLLYIVFAGGLIGLVVKGRVRYLEKKTKALEIIVSNRTVKIREQKSQIEEQARQLQELDRIKSRFFANISHEFRTPLTLILGPLEERIAKAKNKRDKKDLSMMHHNASRLLQLINQLLDLSRLDAGKMRIKTEQGDFVVFLKRIVVAFTSLAEKKKIKLDIKTPRRSNGTGQLSGVDIFDPDKIEKIFTNLLSNAFKFTPEGGEIRVEVQDKIPGTSEVSGTYIVTIYDTGIGIAADHLPHVFDLFYQANNSPGESIWAQESSGIGLALTKELVELHHGTITVESQEGCGTMFTIHLPLGKDHVKVNEAVDMPLIRAPKKTPQEMIPVEFVPQFDSEPGKQEIFSTRAANSGDENATFILIVDDHPDIRKYIRKQLEPDYQIVEASNGKQGVTAAMEIIPCLIISDVMMPEMDGYQLCERLKTDEKTSHIPVILLTVKSREEDRLTGLETGADDYLSKPFSSKELKSRVHNLIESRQKLRERFRREGLLQPRQAKVTSTEETFVQKLMNIIEENLVEEDFCPEVLSNKLHMSLRQLQRKTRALTGQTPRDFIRTIRLRRAKLLLVQRAGSVSEVAFQVGFNDLSYFSRCFHKEFGVLPSEVGR